MTRLLAALALLAGFACGEEAIKPPSALEQIAHLAVRDNDGEAHAILVASVAAVESAKRATHRFRARPGELEFRFVGHYPAGGQSGRLYSVEYLVAEPKTKEWETLLELNGTELGRIRALWAALEGRAKREGSRPPLRIQLAWIEDQRARVEDLRDVLAPNHPQAVERFWSALRWRTHGLGGSNLASDPSRLPAKAGTVELLITVPVGD